jgi:O-antigen ligase
LFERSTALYVARATEETGRVLVWPLAFERFLSSPLAGVGVSNIATYVPIINSTKTPHNSFLFIALASGILPLAFFVASWIRAARGAFRSLAERTANAPFLLPLLLYCFLYSQSGNQPFNHHWMIVTLCMAMTASVRRREPLIAVRQVGRHAPVDHL